MPFIQFRLLSTNLTPQVFNAVYSIPTTFNEPDPAGFFRMPVPIVL
jgi:hypothetical protein